MRRRILLGAAVFAAVPLTLDPDRPLPPSFGMQLHGMWDWYWNRERPNEWLRRHIATLVEFGVEVVRVDFGWAGSQPEEGRPSLAWYYNRRLDMLLDELATRGLKVLVTIDLSPGWSRAGGGSDHRFPDDGSAIGPWARWFAATYGDRVLAVEVWNEPNTLDNSGIKDGAERARHYAGLLKTASRGIRAGRPGTRVVLGGPLENDASFIRRVYEEGTRDDFDVVAVHPYQVGFTDPQSRGSGVSIADGFVEVLRVMERHGDAAKPVWWTEFGFPVGIRPGVLDQETAGERLVSTFELARRRFPQVQLGVVYVAHRSDSQDAAYSVLDLSGEPRRQMRLLRNYFQRQGKTRSIV